MLAVCLNCSARFGPDTIRCPQCGSTDHAEDTGATVMPKSNRTGASNAREPQPLIEVLAEEAAVADREPTGDVFAGAGHAAGAAQAFGSGDSPEGFVIADNELVGADGPATPPPLTGAPKAEWVAWAMDRSDLAPEVIAGMTKADLIEMFG